MIVLTALNGSPFVLNDSFIETMMQIPETKINLTTGKFYLVLETQEEVIAKVVAYNRQVFKDAIKLN